MCLRRFVPIFLLFLLPTLCLGQNMGFRIATEDTTITVSNGEYAEMLLMLYQLHKAVKQGWSTYLVKPLDSVRIDTTYRIRDIDPGFSVQPSLPDWMWESRIDTVITDRRQLFPPRSQP